MHCTSALLNESLSDSEVMTLCTFDVQCMTTSEFKGTQYISFTLPDRFQTLAWNLTSSRWDPASGLLEFSHVLAPRNDTLTRGGLLAGSKHDPTIVKFQATRQCERIPDAWLQGTTAGVRLVFHKISRVESMDGTSDGRHYVNFEIVVEDMLFLKQISLKVGAIDQVSMIASYVLSAIALMKTTKIFLQMLIDKYFLSRSKDEVPEDVKRRNDVLTEVVGKPASSSEDTRHMVNPLEGFGRMGQIEPKGRIAPHEWR